MYKTYRAAFPTVAVHPERRDDDQLQNIILVASEGAAPAKEVLVDRWRRPGAHPGAVDLVGPIRGRYERAVATRDVPILTDDYAPTDALLFVE